MIQLESKNTKQTQNDTLNRRKKSASVLRSTVRQFCGVLLGFALCSASVLRLIKTLLIAIIIFFVSAIFLHTTHASFNEKINYQGKLTNTSGVAVANGSYNVRFRLCTASDCAGGADPIWVETLCYSPDSGTTCDGTGTDQRVSVSNGLFSVLAGGVSSLSAIDFNQTLYLEVQVGGSGTTPAWETLTPRKALGAVPAAFEAKELGGATWAAPSAIGTGTPNTGAFTGLTSSGNIDLSSLSAGGLVKATVTTGRLSIASGGSDYENPLTFSNGLTRATNTVKLGGTLTANTDVPLGGYNFSFSGAGNVGINDTAPTNKRLSVLGSGAQTAAYYGTYIANTATSSTASINKYGAYISSTGTWNGTSANNYGLYVDTPTDGTNNYAAVFAGGNVGIGTASPLQKLHVNQSGASGTLISDFTSVSSTGDARSLVRAAAGSGTDPNSIPNIAIAAYSDTHSTLPGFAKITAYNLTNSFRIEVGNGTIPLTFYNGGFERMRIDNGGNVGIGDTTPDGLLDVESTGAVTASNYGINLSNLATSSTASINKYGAYISSTGTWNGTSANNYGLYVDTPTGGTNNYAAIFAGGNVGIGTAAPTEPLNIVKNQNASTNILVQNTTAGTAASTNIRVSNDMGLMAQIGIYSASTTAFGAIAASDAYLYSTAAGLNVMANNANGIIKFSTGGNSEKMRIDNTGNVGIGTAAPAYPLDVTITTTSTSNTYNINSIITANPGAASSAVYGGNVAYAKSALGNAQNFTGSLRGINAVAEHNGTGTLTSAFGSIGRVTNLSSGTITTAYGVDGIITTSGSGTIASARAINALISAGAGTTITDAYGVYVESIGRTGTVTNSYGVYVADTVANNYFGGNVGINDTAPTNKRLSVLGSGAQTAAYYGTYIANTATSSTASINKYGAYISSTGTWNGASANNYGLYVDTPTGGTNNYAAVFAGGNVGIGTISPDAKLNVASGQISFGAISTNALFNISTAFTGATNASGLRLVSALTPTTGNSVYGLNIAPTAGSSTENIADAATILVTPPGKGNSGTLTNLYGVKIATSASTSTNAYGLYVDAPTGGSAVNAAAYFNGNVGIGTAGPESRVQISGGGLCVGSDANCNTDNNTEGVVYSSSTAMTAYDVAENYPTKDATLIPSEVVAIDNSQNGPFVKRGNIGESLLGIVSTAPAVLMGGFNGQEYKEEKQVAVALSGRVPVKVSLENGPIKTGDYLISSSIPGVAMRADKAGRVIGMALESYNGNETPSNSPLSGGEEMVVGKVLVFVNPHWYGGVLAKNGTLANPNGEEIIASLGQSQSFKDLVMDTVKESLASLSGTVRAAGEWTFDKITAKQICVEDVCVDKSQLQELLEKNQIQNSYQAAPSPVPESVQSAPDSLLTPVPIIVDENITTSSASEIFQP